LLVQPEVLGSPCDQDHVWTTFQRYDPAADKWTEVGALPEPRYAAAVTANDRGDIYVMGGTRTTIDSECGWSVDPVDGKSFVLEPAP